jgi:hypothetical protein
MGKEEWDRRFTNISNYHITLKTKPILLNEKPNKRGKTFISQQYLCQDLSMWYLYNIHNYIHNPSICDLGLIARTIPKVLRIAEALHLLKMQNGFKSKMDYLLREKCKEIENIFFEILVANLYLRNKAKNVDFLFAKSKKLADLLVSFNNNGELYIECKRKAKESEYARKERENWYTQYLPVQEYLKNNKISLVLKITFHNEINSYEDDFLYNIVLPYLKSTSIGILINTDQIRVEFYNPLFENINNGTIWKDYSPSFTQELFGFNDDKYGITSCFLSKRESPLSDYIYDVIFACAGLWFCDSPEAIEKKSLSFKRYICEGIGQIPYDKNGVLHICYESYEGSMVEKLNFDRTYLDLTDLKVQNKKIHFVYIHNLRLMWPPNKNWDVEETVYPFSSDYTNYEYSIEVPHIVAYP